MIDWLRLLLMIFYAPVRGMREIRDRGSLAPAAFMALLGQAAYSFVTDKYSGISAFGSGGELIRDLFQAAITVVIVAVVLVPILTLVANMFDRRGSFRVVITQEYAPVAATMFYVLTAANLYAILIATIFHFTGPPATADHEHDPARRSNARDAARHAGVCAGSRTTHEPRRALEELLSDVQARLVRDRNGAGSERRVSHRRRCARWPITIVSVVAATFITPIALRLFSGVFGSPFILFLVFMLLRGYFSDIMGTHRAKAAFKQNLESATLNPADASAHYNLGLIHQSRGELDQARERFERALQIDEGEVDASYQLGRIARQQKRYPDAIKNFEHVVMRDPAHSQHEIWREVAATYIAAGQFEDARNALEQFLEHRPSDPEGLYLMGRAHAGLGHKREATNLMQACIEAVKTGAGVQISREQTLAQRSAAVHQRKPVAECRQKLRP
jgi:tetratricopeptide (TPR) repeat protein